LDAQTQPRRGTLHGGLAQNADRRTFALIKLDELRRALDPRFDRRLPCGLEAAISQGRELGQLCGARMLGCF
jgi:hypothetical protein